MDCEFVGKTYKIADTTFISNAGMYLTKLEDYAILTNFDCTFMLESLPRSLKRELQSKWRYALHISHGMSPSVTRNQLYSRVIGGEILAYKYMECSIDGNEAVYYGFIPTESKHADILGTHKRCRFAMQAVFPRSLYLHIEKVGECGCAKPGCVKLQALAGDGVQKGRFCASDIPWTKLYVIMGELDEACEERIKEPRECSICAQCFNCSKSVRYCRNHKVCKHKGAKRRLENDGEASFATPRIRDCKIVKK